LLLLLSNSVNLFSKPLRNFFGGDFEHDYNYYNAPLILKMRDIIFFAGKGLKKSRSPRNIPRNGPIMWFAQNKKK
jgi:hypothetical protein